MFKQLLSVSKAVDTYMTKRGRVEAYKILIAQDEKTLEDIGIDRHELMGGVKNWPWNGSKSVETQTPVAQARAIRELSSYSDRELHDLGINRGMITDAVTNGRPGIDATPAPTERRAA